MKKANKSRSPLFRSPVRTLTPEEMARVSGGEFSENAAGKPSSTPIDVEGFR
jgi:hypothetical protein